LKPTLEQHRDGQRLAGSGCHLKQHAAAADEQRLVCSLKALELVRTCIHVLAFEPESSR